MSETRRDTPSGEFVLTDCQSAALRALETTADNAFVTGAAGTGKSRLIREFLAPYDRKTFPVVASTGVAAVLVGGRTFHSFFGLGVMEGGFERTVEKALRDKRVVKRLRGIQGFVLDEVSMIPGVALRAAEAICRGARKKSLPWGGARVVAVGDFAQLPPVGPAGSGRDWAFADEAWAHSHFTPLLLDSVVRTADAEFLAVLGEIREGRVSETVAAYLNSRLRDETSEFLPRDGTFLFPLRRQVERYNEVKLAEVESPVREFPTEYTGAAHAVEGLRKNAPVPETLRLKVGASVMLRVNDPEYRFVNGTAAFVEDLYDDKLLVRLKSGRVIDLEKHAFLALDAEGNESARAVNFPVTLAYAMTIHKSQGVTLDAMVADLRRLWEPGQAYVALSRLKSGKGLSLTGWTPDSIRSDPQVAAFYSGIAAL